MRRVILESPFAGGEQPYNNLRFARACVRDCLLRGESPIASHLLYTQQGVLRDYIPHERQLGIDAGHAWLAGCDAVVVYADYGISAGMQLGIDRAIAAHVPVEYRKLGLSSVE